MKQITMYTLDFRIRVGPTLIYFGKFSHAYALIRVPTFNSFWEMSDGTLWHRSHPEQNAISQCTLNSFSLKLNKSSKEIQSELCHKSKILLCFSKSSNAYGNYDATLIHCLKNSHAYGNSPQIGIVLIGWTWMDKDMLYLILIPEASWFQKCNFQNPRDIFLRFTS